MVTLIHRLPQISRSMIEYSMSTLDSQLPTCYLRYVVFKSLLPITYNRGYYADTNRSQNLRLSSTRFHGNTGSKSQVF